MFEADFPLDFIHYFYRTMNRDGKRHNVYNKTMKRAMHSLTVVDDFELFLFYKKAIILLCNFTMAKGEENKHSLHCILGEANIIK